MVGRKAGWAKTWRLGPTADAARALTGGPVAARRRQGLGLEHHR
jgi:hypothetical protein